MDNERQRVFVDMDGTLAKFQTVDYLERLYEEGYFLNLPPQQNVVDAVKILIEENPEKEVFVLSAVLSDSDYALNEKNRWLDEYLPEVDSRHRIFPPCGENKLDYIPGSVRENDYLLDDYTTNLVMWEPPAKGVKLLNGINHTRGTWQGSMISKNDPPHTLKNKLLYVMEGGQLRPDGYEMPEETEDLIPNQADFQRHVKILDGAYLDYIGVDWSMDARGDITVNDDLSLTGSEITELPDNLTVSGFLELTGTAVTELPNGLTVKGDLYLNHGMITKLPDDLNVKGNLDLSWSKITELPDNLTVGGWLDLRGTAITELPDNLTVGGDLYLMETSITKLPDNLSVGGNLNLYGTAITELPDNLTVGGWLNLRETAITELPNGLVVEGNLYLEDSSITELPDDLTVRGEIIGFEPEMKGPKL